MTGLTTAMILAAGFGTRMGALTENRPKPLIPVAGRTLLDHVLHHAEEAGVTKAVINLHYLGDQIRTHLESRGSPEIVYSEEMPEILDTGGGVVQALPYLGPDPFFGINSDAIFAGANPFEILAQQWDARTMDSLLLLVPVSEALSYTREGDFFLDAPGGAPRRRGAADRAPMVFSGAQIIAPHVLRDVPKGPFSMNIIWDRLFEQQRLAAVTYPDPWVDVGTPDGLDAANRLLGASAR